MLQGYPFSSILIQYHMTIIKAITVIFLLTISEAFYIYLNRGVPQCFYHHIYPEQQLLVELDLPIISVDHEIRLKVKNNNTLIMDKDVTHHKKINVPRSTYIIKDKQEETELEYQSCFQLIQDRLQLTEQEKTQKSLEITQGYIISIKMMTSFDHKIENKLEDLAKENLNYKKITSLSSKLYELNHEQVNLHQIHEVQQKITQTYLGRTKEKIIFFSIIEIFLLIFFTVIEAKILSNYIKTLSII